MVNTEVHYPNGHIESVDHVKVQGYNLSHGGLFKAPDNQHYYVVGFLKDDVCGQWHLFLMPRTTKEGNMCNASCRNLNKGKEFSEAHDDQSPFMFYLDEYQKAKNSNGEIEWAGISDRDLPAVFVDLNP